VTENDEVEKPRGQKTTKRKEREKFKKGNTVKSSKTHSIPRSPTAESREVTNSHQENCVSEVMKTEARFSEKIENIEKICMRRYFFKIKRNAMPNKGDICLHKDSFYYWCYLIFKKGWFL
jgi:hypothetical protein